MTAPQIYRPEGINSPPQEQIQNGFAAGMQLSVERNPLLGIPTSPHEVVIGPYSTVPQTEGDVPLMSAEYQIMALRGVSRRLEVDKARTTEELKKAQIDSKTGLLTNLAWHGHAVDILERRRATGNTGSIIIGFSDLDRFKALNDEVGHMAGDVMLRRVSDCATASFRRSGDIAGIAQGGYDESDENTVGRFGGEELVFMLPDTTMKGAVVAAARFQAMVNKLNFPDANGNKTIIDGRATQGISIGLAELHITDGEAVVDSLERALHEADKGLYEAKNNGRNTIRVFGIEGDPILTARTNRAS